MNNYIFLISILAGFSSLPLSLSLPCARTRARTPSARAGQKERLQLCSIYPSVCRQKGWAAVKYKLQHFPPTPHSMMKSSIHE